jgi:molecular chaperone DnaK
MKQVVSKAVGIDLGTTNSVVAVMNATDNEILLHRDPISKSPTTPSCVWRNPATGETVVGRRALIHAGRAPEPVRSVKRLMGQPVTVALGKDQVTPEEVSAEILAEMKRQIETDVAGMETPATSWTVERAIVTVPAYFDQPQIDATRRAAQRAGLDVLELLHEPTAAARYYCWEARRTEGVFLVYDLGGGTFDVSVVRCVAGAFDVLGISGNRRLGGDNIDAALAERLRAMLVQEGWALDPDIAGDAEDQLRFNILKLIAEGAKKTLSDSFEYFLRDNGQLADKQGNPVIIETLLERAEFEEIARPFVERTLVYCDEALERAQRNAGITLADVDEIILAGGSTHMPLVRDVITRQLCSPAGDGSGRAERAKCAAPVYRQVDTIVALGAAIQATAAGGVQIYDSERTVRVSFGGRASVGMASTHITATVEALGSGLDLSNGHVRLTTPDHSDESDLSATGTFAFTSVPLQPNAENALTFEVFDGTGKLRATVGRPLLHDEAEAKRPVSPLDVTAVCAKPILLEVSRGGRTHRKELVAALNPLPTSAEFEFTHPGDTETVVFRLYQESRQIQDIKVPVPSSTPRGTRIQFHLAVDRHSFITVRGSIGDNMPFDAAVELPPPRPMPSPDEQRALEQQFDEVVQFLPPGRRNTAQIQWDMAHKSLRSASEQQDVDQMVHEFEQLEEIVSHFEQDAIALDPPKADFDKKVADCVSLNEYVGTISGTHDVRDTARHIEVQRDAGERAYQSRDQQTYADAMVHLRTIYDHLTDIYRRERPSTNEQTITQQAAGATEVGLQLADQVKTRAIAVGRGDLRDEAHEIWQKIMDLRSEAQTRPQHVIDSVLTHRRRLEQIDNILMQSGTGLDRRSEAIPEDLGPEVGRR